MRNTSWRPAWPLIVMLAVAGGCGASGDDPAADTEEQTPPAIRTASPEPGDTAATDAQDTAIDGAQSVASDNKAVDGSRPAPVSPHLEELMPEQFLGMWDPWTGDFEGMIERRLIRVAVPFGGYQYYFVGGRPRGAMVELLQKMESFLNTELGRRNIRVFVVPAPVSRDHLIPYLLQGRADLVAGDLTVTEVRKAELQFSRPLIRSVNEVLVTGPAAPKIHSIDDLSAHEIVVRQSSSYYEHLQDLAARLEKKGLAPPHIVTAGELLEAEDLLEMVNAGMIPMTVLDDYKARFWSSVFPDLTIREDIVLNEGGEIAWAMRPDAPEFAKFVDRFLRKYGRGTLVGNDTFNRYLADAQNLRCSMTFENVQQRNELARWLKMYGDEYGYDWLMIAAQGYQESRLNQSRKSAAGALGIMQIKPSTAADPNVGIPEITVLENNIHAGTKYMRFLSDRYFSDMGELDQWFFSLAAYNAGPARVARLRSEAAKNGLDRNRWFGHVEIVAARRIGHETVTYVSNIYKYYIGYKISEARLIEERNQYGHMLHECAEDIS